MKSKADIIRENLAGKYVLDLGGSGYGENNPYERELKDAWALTQRRFIVDQSPLSDFIIDLNGWPLRELKLSPSIHITTAFDILEHLDCPVQVLSWIPTSQLIVNFPNALSPIVRWIERSKNMNHLYSFTSYTAQCLMARSGWHVDHWHFTLGKWSPLLRVVNSMASIYPELIATGITLYCSRASNCSPVSSVAHKP